MKDIVILGGPNGAGKTTAARVLLLKFPQVREFLNVDEFAREISPNNVAAASMAAGRQMLRRMHELIRQGVSFGLESTLSGRSYVATIFRSKVFVADTIWGFSICSTCMYRWQMNWKYTIILRGVPSSRADERAGCSIYGTRKGGKN